MEAFSPPDYSRGNISLSLENTNRSFRLDQIDPKRELKHGREIEFDTGIQITRQTLARASLTRIPGKPITTDLLTPMAALKPKMPDIKTAGIYRDTLKHLQTPFPGQRQPIGAPILTINGRFEATIPPGERAVLNWSLLEELGATGIYLRIRNAPFPDGDRCISRPEDFGHFFTDDLTTEDTGRARSIRRIFLVHQVPKSF